MLGVKMADFYAGPWLLDHNIRSWNPGTAEEPFGFSLNKL
jgi:hypothetical protein